MFTQETGDDGDACLLISSGAKAPSACISSPMEISPGSFYLLRYISTLDTLGGSLSVSRRNADNPAERGAWKDFPAYLPYLYVGRSGGAELVIRPTGRLRFLGISSTSLKAEDSSIPESNVSFRQLEYVFISNPSPVSPTVYRGFMGDPLVPVSRREIQHDNLVLWVTVSVPPGQRAGLYKGTLRVEAEPDMLIPWQVEVYDFELPEFSTFRTSFGGTHLSKAYPTGALTVADFHHVSSREDMKRLAREYYTVMAENKFYPGDDLP